MAIAIRPTIDVGNQGKVRFKASGCKQFHQEGMQQALVEIIIDLATIYRLRKQGNQGVPWHFFWWEIGTALKRRKFVLIDVH